MTEGNRPALYLVHDVIMSAMNENAYAGHGRVSKCSTLCFASMLMNMFREKSKSSFSVSCHAHSEDGFKRFDNEMLLVFLSVVNLLRGHMAMLDDTDFKPSNNLKEVIKLKNVSPITCK